MLQFVAIYDRRPINWIVTATQPRWLFGKWIIFLCNPIIRLHYICNPIIRLHYIKKSMSIHPFPIIPGKTCPLKYFNCSFLGLLKKALIFVLVNPLKNIGSFLVDSLIFHVTSECPHSASVASILRFAIAMCLIFQGSRIAHYIFSSDICDVYCRCHTLLETPAVKICLDSVWLRGREGLSTYKK